MWLTMFAPEIRHSMEETIEGQQRATMRTKGKQRTATCNVRWKPNQDGNALLYTTR